VVLPTLLWGTAAAKVSINDDFVMDALFSFFVSFYA
jgi:hypothetical protein